MSKLITVLLYLACVGEGRRVQPMEHLQSGPSANAQISFDFNVVETAPSMLIQVQAGWAKVKSKLNPYNYIASDWHYNNFREQVYTFPGRKPFEFSVLLATLKTWSADATVQFLQRPRDTSWSFDWRRSAAFAVFGCLYVGLAQWFLYISVMTSLFPDAVIFANEPWSIKYYDRVGQAEWIGQIFMDICVFTAFCYYPAFYTIKAILQESDSITSRVHTGLRKYWANITTDWLCSASVWFACDLVIYAQPIYLRMPLAHTVSFGWTMFISFMRGASNMPETKSEK